MAVRFSPPFLPETKAVKRNTELGRVGRREGGRRAGYHRKEGRLGREGFGLFVPAERSQLEKKRCQSEMEARCRVGGPIERDWGAALSSQHSNH